MADQDEFEVFDDLLPEGSIPLHGFRVVAYLDQDGDRALSWGKSGDCLAADTLGLIEVAKFNCVSTTQDGTWDNA